MTPLARRASRSRPRQGEAVILFTVNAHRFAIAASAIDEIRNAESLESIPGGTRIAKVSQTLKREGRRFFVVDAGLHFRLPPLRPARVLLLRNSAVALAVQTTDRMTEVAALHPLPQSFHGEEREWYRGLALIGDDVVPVVNPAEFLSAFEQEQLEDEHLDTHPQQVPRQAKSARRASV